MKLMAHLLLCLQVLALFCQNPDEFLRRYITVDERRWNRPARWYTDYLKKGQTITRAYNASLLRRWSEKIKKKRPHLKKILLHQDNARVHTCVVSMDKIMELNFELLQYPPYQPDLALSDFFLIPILKKWLGGQRFTSNKVIA